MKTEVNTFLDPMCFGYGTSTLQVSIYIGTSKVCTLVILCTLTLQYLTFIGWDGQAENCL